MAEWSELPKELLEEILIRLNSPIDALRFRSVCSTWRHSSSSMLISKGRLNAISFPRYSFPMHFNDLFVCKRSIFSLSPPQISIFESPDNCDSWIIKIEEKSPNFFRLFFPLSGTRITPLPSNFPMVMDLSNIRIRDWGCEYFLRFNEIRGSFYNLLMDKVAFLSRTNNVFFLLTTHVSGKLVIFDNVDFQWHMISDDVDLPYDDIIAFNGEFYAVDYTGRTVLVEIDTVNSVILVAKPVCGGDKKRLVEIGGELMLVDVYMGLPPWEDDDHNMEDLDDYVASRSMWFKVFRLDREGKIWVEVKDLGNSILFLGMYSAFSVSTADLSLQKGNCIYFGFPDDFYPSHFNEDDDIFKFHCGGVFNLEDASISYPKLFWPPPRWITSSS